jgi:hypothetical protein
VMCMQREKRFLASCEGTINKNMRGAATRVGCSFFNHFYLFELVSMVDLIKKMSR